MLFTKSQELTGLIKLLMDSTRPEHMNSYQLNLLLLHIDTAEHDSRKVLTNTNNVADYRFKLCVALHRLEAQDAISQLTGQLDIYGNEVTCLDT